MTPLAANLAMRLNEAHAVRLTARSIIKNELEFAQSPLNHDFSTNLQILEGPKGGGLVFNSQSTDSVRESHIVRFGSNDGNDYLIYGYFDENRSFNPQGSAQPPAFSEAAKLGVSVTGSTYDILVNDEVIARDIPLVYLGGRVGLTTWNSSVGFGSQ